jgi:hypothetical protein
MPQAEGVLGLIVYLIVVLIIAWAVVEVARAVFT